MECRPRALAPIVPVLLAMTGCGGGGGGNDAGTDVQVEETVEDPQADPDRPDVPADTVSGDDPPREGECSMDEHCDDGDPCTTDTCDLLGSLCLHEPVDGDGDGYVAVQVAGEDCGGNDCDDGDESVYPGAAPGCDDVDRDCSGAADEDEDGDGYVAERCGGDDCDDGDSGVNPAATVGCTTDDRNCNGHPDEDDDGDGYVAATCGGDDCDDGAPAVFPGAEEICGDGVDQDCDGLEDGLVDVLAGDLRVTTDGILQETVSLAWSGSEFALVWADDAASDRVISLARIAGGTLVGAPATLAAPGAEAWEPVVVWAGSAWAAFWQDENHAPGDTQIHGAWVGADGAVLVPDAALTASDGLSTRPDAAWSGSTVGLVWQDDGGSGDHQVWFALAGPAGLGGSAEQVTSHASDSYVPSVAWSGSEWGVAWSSDRTGSSEIWFVRLDSSGARIGSDVQVTDAPAASTMPRVAWSGSLWGIAWQDRRLGSPQVYLTCLDAEGVETGSDLAITTAGSTGGPDLAWSGSWWALAWDDDVGERQILVALADGVAVGSAVQVTVDPHTSRAPAIAWAGTGLGVAWTDGRDPSDEIYWDGLAWCD